MVPNKIISFDILTAFPEGLAGFFRASILARAQRKSLIKVNLINLRDFASDKRRTIDDRPYGGGPGMVLMVEPIVKALKKIKQRNSRVILLSASGKKLNRQKIIELSKLSHLIIIWGDYEGVAQRIADYYVDEEISIGDYVLTGGEAASLVLVDAVSRYVPKVLKNEASLNNESFDDNLLGSPSYTRPENYLGHKIPNILRSGNHEKIREWHKKEALSKTKKFRPDLFPKN